MPGPVLSNKKPLVDLLDLPLIAAPMFLVSTPKMVVEACRNGVMGSFPALNQRSSEGLGAWLLEIKTSLEKTRADEPERRVAPYAVNLIVNSSNTRLEQDLTLCIEHKVPVVITSLGIRGDVIEAIHDYGGIVLHDVAITKHAVKAANAGVDGLIAVAAGAGGHAGTMSPFALVNEIRQFFDGILILAGCISHGKDILAAQAMGADLAYMGTRFINTVESAADQAYKDMICEAHADDILYTSAVSGVPANFLIQSLKNAGLDIEKIRESSSLPGTPGILKDEAKAWKTIWSAGQGVGSITNVPTIEQLIQRLRSEYSSSLNLLHKKF